MLKKSLAIFLVLMMIFSLAACGQKPATEETTTEEAATTEETATTEEATASNENWKIGIMTGTVSQNEEEYRAAQDVLEEYGEEHVILMTYPDKFMDEQETTIANLVSMASDPDVKALIMVQAVPGASAAFDKVKELRDDLLIIAGVPGEDPKMIASKADIVFAMDEISMGHTIVEQAKKQGAKTLVHYSFPRHMSYPLLSKRRDLLRENCKKEGLEFVDATAPDPTGDAGVSGAQQFILEDVPRKIEQYGKDTALFSTNCSMQVPLIKATLDAGGIYPQPCCPSPYHGFPSALGIKIPEDKKGDIEYVVEESKKKIAAKGGTGRFSTWPVPCAMMFVDAGSKYAKAYIDGETNGKFDIEVLKEKCKDYAGLDVGITPLDEDGIKYDNYLLVLMDYLNY